MDKKNKIIFAPGFGGSYSTKSHITHPNNRYLGTPFNYSFKADLLYSIPLNMKERCIALFIRAYHTSNGSFTIPNGGLNIALLGLKFNY